MDQNTQPQQPKQDFMQYLTPVTILLAAIIIGGALIYTHITPANQGGVAGTGTNGTGQQAQPSVNIKDVNIQGEPFIGDANAPVTIAYWSDYQCPFCKQFETTVLPSIIKNYIDTKKVKVVFKDFQFLGPDSSIDALYARAIWNLYPNQYFAWRTAMFNAQDGENTGFGDEASVVKLTKTISGIDAAKVTQAVAQNKDTYQKAIDADRDEAQKFGIQGTPAFILGKQLIPGAMPYSNFSQAIDALLK